MNKLFYISIFAALLAWTSCNSDKDQDAVVTDTIEHIVKDTVPQKEVLYTWVNSLNVRDEPNLKSKTLVKLKEGAKVVYQGKIGGEITTVTLRGKKIASNFKEITTTSGLKGWVFGGALKPLEQQLEPDPDQEVIRLENKILTLEETNLGKLWLNELEIITVQKLNRVFLKENISFLFNNEGYEKYNASHEGENIFIIQVNRDTKENHVIKSVNISSEKISDQYGVFVGMTFEEIKKKRPSITQSTNNEGKTIAYQRKSNIMYEICCPIGDKKTQYGEDEIKEWKVERIIWQQND